MKIFKGFFTIFIFFVFIVNGLTNAQHIKIQANVRDINTHRNIPNVNIYVKGSDIGTVSNISGKFELVIPPHRDDLTIVFRHIAYDLLELPLSTVSQKQNIYLQPRVIPLKGTSITGERIQEMEIEQDLPQRIATLNNQSFEMRGYVDAGDLLKTDHSVQINEDLSGKKTVSIRAGNPDEVIVLYNGIKMNNAYNNIFDLALIDLADIKRFEIIKGSNTALYGPEAFSGVINIVPKIKQDYNIRFQQRIGTYRSGNWGLQLHHKINNLAGSYSYKQGGSKRTFAGVEEGQNSLENNSLHHTANLVYSFPQDSEKNEPNSLSAMFVYTSLNHENQRDVESVSNFNNLISLKYKGNIFFLKNFDIDISRQELDEEQYLSSGTGSLYRKLGNEAVHFNLNKKFKIGNIDVLMGYQFEHNQLDFINERKNFYEEQIGLESSLLQRQHHGMVSIIKFKDDLASDFLKTMNVNLSFRYDMIQDDQKNPILRGESEGSDYQSTVGLFDKNRWDETMFKFALELPGYSNNLSLQSFLNFGVNTKFPTLLQQISLPEYLSPEKNNSFEFGFEVTRDTRNKENIYGWKISGNFFRNQYENKFRSTTSPGLPILFYDAVPNAKITGFETTTTAFLFQKKIALELGVSRYFISDKSAFPFKSDNKQTFDFTLNHAGYSLQFHWFNEGEQVGLIRTRYTSTYPDIYGGTGNPSSANQFAELALPAYSNIDVHLSKTFQIFNFKIFINFSGRNLIKDEEILLEGLAIRDRRLYITAGIQY